MNKGALIYIIRLLAERFIGAALFFATAGSFDLRSGIFFSVYILVAVVSAAIIYRKNPNTLKERGKVNTNSPKWDKILLLVFWLSAFFVVYYAAGKTVPLGMEIEFDFIAGMAIYLASAVITVKAMLENKSYPLEEKIKDLQFTSGAKFFDPAQQEVFPEKDFHICTQADRFDFVLKLVKTGQDIPHIAKGE